MGPGFESRLDHEEEEQVYLVPLFYALFVKVSICILNGLSEKASIRCIGTA